jgi:hypothetical protein
MCGKSPLEAWLISGWWEPRQTYEGGEALGQLGMVGQLPERPGAVLVDKESHDCCLVDVE